MPDGKRKRRYSTNAARRLWYAIHRSCRFGRRFGWGSPGLESLLRQRSGQFAASAA